MKILLNFLFCISLALGSEATLQEFTNGNNLFTSQAYREVIKYSGGNFLISPLSAEILLALTQSGAKDATSREIGNVLHLPNSQKEIESTMRNLQGALRSSDLYTLKQANKIYVKNDYAVNENFKRAALETFGADLENVDFNQREATAGNINQWVERSTEQKIRNLVNPDDLTRDTRLLLINALYFKGNWSTGFEKFRTNKNNFFKSEVSAVPVQTMHDLSTKKYFESLQLNAKFLELPYEGNDVSLTIVLPNNRNGLSVLEQSIDKVLATPNYSEEIVDIAIPKFRIESRLNLKQILKGLGLKKIFNASEADLTGIAGKKGDLVVSKIIQKTFVEVNEEGTEAAAASFADVVVPLSGIVSLTPPKEFIADHPFIFYIKVKDLIIFVGRVVDPSL